MGKAGHPDVRVVLGDIVRQADCDGIVNSANEYLIAGGGVCGAIHAAAGPSLEVWAKRFAPLGLGEAIATPGFDMSCRHIVHVRGPRYHQDPDPAENLARALRNGLRLADDNGLRRLAVPAISLGVYGYPASEGVPILVDTAFAVGPRLRNLEEIRFVVVEPVLCRRFQSTLDSRRLIS